MQDQILGVIASMVMPFIFSFVWDKTLKKQKEQK